MKKILLIAGLSLSLSAFAYDPKAASRNDLAVMQANSFGIVTNSSTNGLTDIAYGLGAAGSRYCATSGTAGVNAAFAGSRLGSRWATGTTPANSILNGLGYSSAQDIFVAVGYVNGGSTPLFLTSTDCLTWTSRTTPDSNLYRNVAASPSIIVAVGGNFANTSCSIASSATGVTWTTASMTGSSCASADSFFNVIWNGTKFVAIGASRISTSTNGTSWVNTSAPANVAYSDIAWNGKIFVATSQGFSGNTTRISTSPDGVTWTVRPFSLGTAAKKIIWTGKYFLTNIESPLTGFTGAYSFDGITWKGVNLPSDQITGWTTDGVRVLGTLGSPTPANESIIRSIGLDF